MFSIRTLTVRDVVAQHRELERREAAGDGTIIRGRDGKPLRFYYGCAIIMSNDLHTAMEEMGDALNSALGGGNGAVYLDSFGRQIVPHYVAHIARLATQTPATGSVSAAEQGRSTEPVHDSTTAARHQMTEPHHE